MNQARMLAWVLLVSGPAWPAAHGVFGVAPRPVTPQSVSWRATMPLARGVDHWANGRRPEALRWFRLAVGVAPRDSLAWHDLGVALYTASRYDEALDAFTKERFLVSRAPSASYGLAETEFALGRLDDAERDAFVAVAMAPREPAYWQVLGDILAAEHRPDAAKSAWARATTLAPHVRRVVWSPADVQRSILTLRFPRTATY